MYGRLYIRLKKSLYKIYIDGKGLFVNILDFIVDEFDSFVFLGLFDWILNQFYLVFFEDLG